MRVLKIIQANPEVFNEDQNGDYTELEAIRTIAAMSCSGNEIQKVHFEIRQTHTAICNLISLGFREIAIDLAVKLIPKAELSQQYKIAQDLCDQLITHFYHVGNLESAHFYKTLYDKFTGILSYEHESMLLYGKAIQNYKQIHPVQIEGLDGLLKAIKQKLPMDCIWYHYYYYQFQSLLYAGKELEKIYLEAINYFEELYANHNTFTSHFAKELISYYEENEEFEKAKELAIKQKIIY